MYVTINDAQLYIEIYGEENERSILFLHGGPGMGDCRGDILTFKEKLENEYKLVFVDLRGSGRSTDIPPYSHEQWVEDIEEIRKQCNLTKLIILGSSYGGFLAQEYAVKYPENVEYLILNVTSPDDRNSGVAIRNAIESQIDITLVELTRLFNGEVQSNEDFKMLYKKIQPLYVKDFDPVKAEERLNSIFFHYETHNVAFKNLVNFDMLPKLKDLTCKVLITSGEKDWITPPECGEKIYNASPQAVFIVFKEYGHSFVREIPSDFIAILQRFLHDEFTTTKQRFMWEEGELSIV